MRIASHAGSWYLPGRLYDLAFGGMFRALKRRVAAAVGSEGLYPWLDICCGTGSQFRELGEAFGGGSVGGGGRRGKGEKAREGRRGGRQPGSRGPVFGLDKNLGMVTYAAARASGLPFVCGDAGRLPFKDRTFRAVTVSFGIHDKSPALRKEMMAEARRVLALGGRLIAVDFENPWNAKSKAAALAVRAVEHLAGGEHYRNGRDFLKRGGLRAFLRECGFVEVSRSDIAAGSISVVVARVSEQNP